MPLIPGAPDDADERRLAEARERARAAAGRAGVGGGATRSRTTERAASSGSTEVSSSTLVGARSVGAAHDEAIDEASCRARVATLAEGGLLRYVVPSQYGGEAPEVRVGPIAAAREELAYADGLLDLLFVMQGLGSFPITLAGTEDQKARYLPDVASGARIAAFAVTEPDAGSDLGAIRTSAQRDGDVYRLQGVKCFISNAPFADLFTVIARTAAGSGRDGLTAFIVERSAPGLEASADIELMAPHPIGTVRMTECRVPAGNRIGAEGDGFRIAMGTLDRFRATVGGAAVGFAQRALDEALRYAGSRVQFGRPIAEFEGIQFKLADLATKIEAARLLVAHAAATIDRATASSTGISMAGQVAASAGADGKTGREAMPDGTARGAGTAKAAESFPLSALSADPSRAAAMAKLFATEVAQEAADEAVQIHGGRGLVRGSVVERIYREVRALRIYEGTSEIQRTIIGRSLLRE